MGGLFIILATTHVHACDERRIKLRTCSSADACLENLEASKTRKCWRNYIPDGVSSPFAVAISQRPDFIIEHRLAMLLCHHQTQLSAAFARIEDDRLAAPQRRESKYAGAARARPEAFHPQASL